MVYEGGRFHVCVFFFLPTLTKDWIGLGCIRGIQLTWKEGGEQVRSTGLRTV